MSAFMESFVQPRVSVLGALNADPFAGNWSCPRSPVNLLSALEEAEDKLSRAIGNC